MYSEGLKPRAPDDDEILHSFTDQLGQLHTLLENDSFPGVQAMINM